MGMFKKQSRRLLRPGLQTVEQALQEVWAVLNSDDVIEIDSPVVFAQLPDPVPPITILLPPDPTGAYVQPIQVLGVGPPIPAIPDFAGPVIPTIPPWTGLPGVVTDAGSGIPHQATIPPGVPPIPGTIPPTTVPPVPPVPLGPPHVLSPPPEELPVDPNNTGGGGGGGNAFTFEILSQVAGQTYSCSVRIGGATITQNCLAEAVDAAAVVPNGTRGPGVLEGGVYYIYPPVFTPV
jgi:hypothetical protein